MIFLKTDAHKYVCLCSEGETSEENKNDSTTERNFPFVNKVTKEKLRLLPYFCKKIENCVLGNLYPWSNDRQIKWLRSRKTRPDLSPCPNSKIRAPGKFQETLQIEVGAVKMARAQQLREGPQDFTGTGCEWLRSGWRNTEEEEAQCWCCQSPSAPPVQVGQRYPKYLPGLNSRFIHSDAIQRKLSKEMTSVRTGGRPEFDPCLCFCAETEINFHVTNPKETLLLLRSHWDIRRDLETLLSSKNPFYTTSVF